MFVSTTRFLRLTLQKFYRYSQCAARGSNSARLSICRARGRVFLAQTSHITFKMDLYKSLARRILINLETALGMKNCPPLHYIRSVAKGPVEALGRAWTLVWTWSG